MEKENSEFKPVKLRLKIDLVSYPDRAEGLVNMDMEHKSDGYNNGPRMLGKGVGGVGNQRTDRSHPTHSNTKIGRNTENWTPVKDDQLTLV